MYYIYNIYMIYDIYKLKLLPRSFSKIFVKPMRKEIIVCLSSTISGKMKGIMINLNCKLMSIILR